MYQKRQELGEREKGALEDLLDTLAAKGLLRKKEKDHYEFTGKETPTTIKTHTKEEKDFLDEYDRFQSLIYVYLELYIRYSGDTSLPDHTIQSMKSVIGSSLKEIIPESYKEKWTNIYLTLKSESIQEAPKIEELEEQGRDIRVANYQVLQNFILLIKSIVEFKKYIELNIRELNSIELGEISKRFSTSIISKDAGSRDLYIPNLLIESKEVKSRQLLIIENPPEDLSDSITSLQQYPSFNLLILKIKTSIMDDLMKTTPPKVTASGKILTEVWVTPVWTVKIPDESMFSDAIEGTLLWISHTYEEAIKSYDKALEIEPRNVETWSNKGISLSKLGRYEEALSCYNTALDIHPGYLDALNNKGNALANLGRFDEAISYYDKALEIDPKNAKTWYDKGKALGSLGKYEEAVGCYDKALQIDPQYADEAIRFYDKAKAIRTDFADAWNAEGFAYSIVKKYDEAVKAYDKALEIDPKYINALNGKGLVLEKIAKYEEAVKAYDQAIFLDPKYAWYLLIIQKRVVVDTLKSR